MGCRLSITMVTVVKAMMPMAAAWLALALPDRRLPIAVVVTYCEPSKQAQIEKLKNVI